MDNNEELLTVTEVNQLIKNSINKKFKKQITVIGEISNLKISKNHLFMNLKDKEGIINVVCWNYTIKFNIELNNGDNVKINGFVNVSTKYGNYNLSAIGFKIDGIGDLHKEYELVKQKCEELGFFDINTKLELPKRIDKIGVITALGGAALKDFLYVLEHGEYKGEIYIKGCSVQGKECSSTVINSLEIMDKMNLDIIVITRGGGSFEDLYGFSDYKLLEAIYKTKTCTISAIGHEIDFMLSDYVADIRSPTPSIAGETIYNHQQKLNNFQKYNEFLINIKQNIKNKFNSYLLNLAKLEQKLVSYDKILENSYNNINEFYNNTNIKLKNKLKSLKDLIENLNSKLDNAHPSKVLNSGFAIISDPYTNNTISSINELKYFIDNDKKLKIQFKDGVAFIKIIELDK